MTSKLARFVTALAVVFLCAGCGSTEMTDRLEATYAIADFEIEGAERSRAAFKDTIVDGPQGISQTFIAADGVTAIEVFEMAIAAAEADGWELNDVPGSMISYRALPSSTSCDALRIYDPVDGVILVDLRETTRCP